MLELVKENKHMNRWKNQINSQITLDDDFIVPDSMSDLAQVILNTGEVQLDPVKIQNEKIIVRGKLDFHVLYRKEEGGLQTLGGIIPFEETLNIPNLEEKDYVGVSWQLEDMGTEIINSRKLSIKAIVTLEAKVEALFDVNVAVSLGTVDDGIECLQENMEIATIALRKKDTYRLKQEVTLSGSKPAIDRLLWTEMNLCGVTTKPLDGKIRLEGSLMVFVIYEGEGEQSMVQWVEESIPFSGEIEMPGAREIMIPAISVRLIHKNLEEKPDYDGEMREIDVDAVMELDVRLYEEETLSLLSDMYATNSELLVETVDTQFDQLLARNTGRCKIVEKIPVGDNRRILQICHCSGSIKLDQMEAKGDNLELEGVVEVRILFLTDDDKQPIQSMTELIPFQYESEVIGIQSESVWYLDYGMEQLTAVMLGSDTIEVKAVLCLDTLALQPIVRPMITHVQTMPLDKNKLKQMPGIVGYLVKDGDSLWSVAKRFHTTMDTVVNTNGLTSKTIQEGDHLLLVKEINK